MKITLTVDRNGQENGAVQSKQIPSWRSGATPPGVHNFTLDGNVPKPIAVALATWLKERHAAPDSAPDYERLLSLLARREDSAVVSE